MEPVLSSIRPRLFGVADAAQYLGVSVTYVRNLVSVGHLKRAHLPAVNGDAPASRRVLIDRAELDRLVEGGGR